MPTRPLCSVVIATFQRAHLLNLSIEGYNRLRFPLDRLEVIVVDDCSTDSTQQVCERFDPRIDLKYIKLRKNPEVWRDCAAVIGVGMRAAKGSVILPTHPEILPGADSVTAVCDLAKDNVWVSCKGYYLSVEDQQNINLVNWKEEGPKSFRQLPGFYKLRECHPDYHPSGIDRVGVDPHFHKAWLSWIFSGYTRRGWSKLGGFIPTSSWGSVDLLLLQRRQKLGIETVTPTGDDEIVAHFNHDTNVGVFKVTDRDMQKAFSQNYCLTVEGCQYPAVDELWGPIP